MQSDLAAPGAEEADPWAFNGAMNERAQNHVAVTGMDSSTAGSGATSAGADPHIFYNHHQANIMSTSPPGDMSSNVRSPPSSHLTHLPTPPAPRSHSRPSSRSQLRSASHPPHSQPALNSVKSTSALLPSKQRGSVKDIANKFNESGRVPLALRTAPDSYRRATREKSRSPTKEGGMTKLQKRRPAEQRSAAKSPSTSFDTTSSFSSSNATVASTRSQPMSNFALNKDRTPTSAKSSSQLSSRPLFGEITSDGQWNGNFDLGAYGALPTFTPTPRRGSDGLLALGHTRSQSHQDMSTPALSPPNTQSLSHRRSRSHMDATLPPLNPLQIPNLYPTPPGSQPRHQTSPTLSRIPVSTAKTAHSDPSAPPSASQSRSQSSMSNPSGRRRLSKSPTRTQQTFPSHETATLSKVPNRRYDPSTNEVSSSSQKLSAKIVAMPKVSPPLRSSRPRQPVSSATTSASRARAAEASQRLRSPTPADRRRPSEQWLGKPYDPQKEQAKRKIPQLGKVDFAERRARIQKAISQNLEESGSRESLRSRDRSQSIVSSNNDDTSASSGAEKAVHGHVIDEERVQHADARAAGNPGHKEHNAPWQDLSVHTVGLQNSGHDKQDPEPMTAATEFEDDSPLLDRNHSRNASQSEDHQHLDSATSQGGAYDDDDATPVQEQPTLLSSATYQPPSSSSKGTAVAPRIETVAQGSRPEPQHRSLLQDVLRMRQNHDRSDGSRDGTEFADDSPAAEYSASDLESKWQSDNTTEIDRSGSIRIMLDGDHHLGSHGEDWAESAHHQLEGVQLPSDTHTNLQPNRPWEHGEYYANGVFQSPVELPGHDTAGGIQNKEDDRGAREETLKPMTFQPHTAIKLSSDDVVKDSNFTNAIDLYRSTGEVSPDMLNELEKRMVDLHGVSRNGGSDAMMVQNLLDSIADSRPQHQPQQTALSKQITLPDVGPNTPSDFNLDDTSAVLVYSAPPDEDYVSNAYEEDDFEAKIRKADEEWERQLRGQDAGAGADVEDFEPPPPPPKDDGYTPRSSIGPNSATFAPNLMEAGLRISTTGHLDVQEIYEAGDAAKSTVEEQARSVPPSPNPPPPVHAPPPPPSPLHMADGVPPFATASSERGSSEMSPRIRRSLWGPGAESSRPSQDSQREFRQPPPVPGSVSYSSFGDSMRLSAADPDANSTTRLIKTMSPGPEQKRLQKRRHIIKELVDTEGTYHQDLKIIEDIYKATVGDLVSPEDRKTLFGNCDEIERFALHFYDELRRSVTAIYIPPKSMRWSNKRSSFSTTQSDGTGQTSVSQDPVDDDRDRSTTVGQVFLRNLARMEQLYGSYLKNHDAANQRLAALQSTTAVKCWLEECHKNASDITSAWDLDSLLVKPTQRVAKYPMLLQQLLESTPANHPDYEPLKTAASSSISMLTRINEAKKRADLVDQIVNRKGKDPKGAAGFSFKMGGITRRTEKLKERVGVAEAFQDPEFDELAHRFGGHFIRLQICMRDVQDYMHRTEKAIGQINNYAQALEQFADATPSTLPEIEGKWRRYALAIHELAAIALADHKEAVHKRVIQPMVSCIKLHEGPQNAINKRKKRIVDYARCRSIEKRGEKPDKKTIEAAELYTALNDQMKIELPKLYNLTGTLVQNCLKCFLDVQCNWLKIWEVKLSPLLDKLCTNIQQIAPEFRDDYNLVAPRLMELGVCNGSLLADAANFLSPTTTIVNEPELNGRRPSIPTMSKRTTSMGSEATSPAIGTPASSRRHSGNFTPPLAAMTGPPVVAPGAGRIRSNSALSANQYQYQQPAPPPPTSANRPWSNHHTPQHSYNNGSRPSTASRHTSQQTSTRPSMDDYRSPRPSSGATYFTARDLTPNPDRYSGVFSSAMPPETSYEQPAARPQSPPRQAPNDMPVQFVCASLFEFNIDGTRKEAGYPYLTYAQGEVFDVLAQKGELWLAKNQDDPTNALGWIWEQHFVVLTAE